SGPGSAVLVGLPVGRDRTRSRDTCDGILGLCGEARDLIGKPPGPEGLLNQGMSGVEELGAVRPDGLVEVLDSPDELGVDLFGEFLDDPAAHLEGMHGSSCSSLATPRCATGVTSAAALTTISSRAPDGSPRHWDPIVIQVVSINGWSGWIG